MKTDNQLPKITKPTIHYTIQRKRLFHLLDKSMHASAIWVAAHAGSGKTTLVSTYIDSRKRQCLWYQFDESDADIASFFHYMGKAVYKHSHRPDPSLPQLTPEHLLNLPFFCRIYFKALFKRIKTGALLVFDNYQILPDNAPIHTAMRILVEEIQPSHNVIFISREQPPADFSRAMASDDFILMNRGHLRITNKEALELSRRLSSLRMTRDHIRTLQSRMKGWMAGWILFLKYSQTHPNQWSGLQQITPEAIFNYLSIEIFTHLDPLHREILLKLSLLPRLTSSLVDAFCYPEQASLLLTNLYKQNLFTEKRDGWEKTFGLHPLFHDFLVVEAKKTFSASRLKKLYARAAGLCAGMGYYEDAIGLWLRCQRYDRACRTILKIASNFVESGRYVKLLGWIERLPESVVSKTPWLVYHAAVCRKINSPRESLARLVSCYKAFKSLDDTHGMALAWSEIIDVHIWVHVDLRPVKYWLKEFITFEEKIKDYGNVDVQAQLAAMAAFSFWLVEPQNPKAVVWANRAYQRWTMVSDTGIKIRIGQCLILHYDFRGDYPKSREIQNMLTRLTAHKETAPANLIIGHVCLSLHHAYHNESHAGWRHAMATQRLYTTTGMDLFEPFFYLAVLFNLLNRRDLQLSKRYFDRYAEYLLSHQDNLHHTHYHTMLGWYESLEGNFAAAVQHSIRACQVARRCGVVFPYLFSIFGLALSLAEQGRLKSATVLLKRALKKAVACKATWFEFTFKMGLVYVNLKAGKRKAGLALLTQSLHLGTQRGFYHLYWALPGMLTALCVTALEHHIQVDFIHQFIRRQQLTPPEGVTPLSNWPWPIKIYTFGHFEIHVDDRPVRISGKTPKKPFELLKTIIAHHSNHVPATYLMDSLWPDSDGDKAMASLKVTIKRLRKILGNSEALQWTQGIIRLNDTIVWSDLRAFETFMCNLTPFYRERSSADTLETDQILSAIAFVKGVFLEGEDDLPVVLARRKSIESDLTRIVDYIANKRPCTNARARILILNGKTASPSNLAKKIIELLKSEPENQRVE